jgi:FkbM family methyltransferase
MREVRRSAVLRLIGTARRVCKGTPVQRLAITSYLYGRTFRYAYPEDELTVDVGGIRLTVPNKDITIVPGLVGGFYEPVQVAIFRALCSVSSSFVDVGANIGLYTCLAARDLPADGLIVSFEPIPENVSYLKANVVQNNHRPDVRIEQAAVGEADRTVTIHLDNQIGTHSISRSNTSGGAGKSLQVPMRSLDSYCRESALQGIDLIKIDVEGYDGHTLHGAQNMLERFKPTILVEFSPQALRNCGFAPNRLIETVCDLHEEVFIIDEKHQSIHRSSRAELLTLASRNAGRVWHSNLVAVTKREHLAAMSRLVADLVL